MTTSNLSTFKKSLLDDSWSIDIVKSLLENPIQVPTASLTITNFHDESSFEHDFMINFLQDLYNPPDNNLNLSKQRLQELQSMRIKDRQQLGFFSKDMQRKGDMGWAPDRHNPVVRIVHKDNERDPQMPRIMNNGFPNGMKPSPARNFRGNMDAFKNRPIPFPFPGLAYNQTRQNDKVIDPKRRMDMNSYFDPPYIRKKLHENGDKIKKFPTKATKVINLIEDDIDTVPNIKNSKKERRHMQNRHLSRTGLKNNKSFKNAIVLLDSPDSNELINNIENDQLSSSTHRGREGEWERLHAEDKENTTTDTNMINMDEGIENEKNEDQKEDEMAADFFDFDADDLGIKILEEVFLCTNCQKEIPKRDVDKGFKELCATCRKSNKSQRAVARMKSQVSSANELFKVEREASEKKVPINKEYTEEGDRSNVLAPLARDRKYYEDTANTNILDPIYNKKHTVISKNHQVMALPLTLYNNSRQRKIRKLWKPERLDPSIYEKFRNDVNGKNSVYLIDEEISEILVRHKYDIDNALNWSLKANPEFQYYVKRSANRRRLITRGCLKYL